MGNNYYSQSDMGVPDCYNVVADATSFIENQNRWKCKSLIFSNNFCCAQKTILYIY
jgi:hypothetical protein